MYHWYIIPVPLSSTEFKYKLMRDLPSHWEIALLELFGLF